MICGSIHDSVSPTVKSLIEDRPLSAGQSVMVPLTYSTAFLRRSASSELS
jgi:hypothetical protein